MQKEDMLSPLLLEGINLSIEESKQIKNIVFDLGRVLIDLLPEKAIAILQQYGLKECGADMLIGKVAMDNLLIMLDTGEVNDQEFYDTIRRYTCLPLTNEQIYEAWMAVLGPFRACNYKILRCLHQHYKLFVLSNTNSIHQSSLSSHYKKLTGKDIFEEFDQVYFSNLMGMRKPDLIIYQTFAQQAGINPSESIFIDDNPQNVSSAREVGFHSFWFDISKFRNIKKLFVV